MEAISNSNSVAASALAAVTIMMLYTQGVYAGDECSVASRSTAAGLEQCLVAMRGLLLDKSRYFYGDTFYKTCPPTSDNAYCVNPTFPSQDSLASKLFGADAESRVNDTIYWLDVQFHSPAGKFLACDHDFVMPNETTFGLDPVHGKAFTPWQIRMSPNITWVPTSGGSRKYTLLIVDPGYEEIRGLITNIPESDVQQGDALITYRGSTNPRPVVNAFVFLLFEQHTSQIDIPFASNLRGHQATSQFINGVIQNYTLGDLRAVNFVDLNGDVYSESELARINSNCPVFVAEAAVKYGIAKSLLPSPLVPNVGIDIVYRLQNTGTTFSDCCDELVSLNVVSLTVDPIGNTAINSIYPSNPPEISLRKIPGIRDTLTMYPHTLVIADFDVTDPTLGTSSLPVIHWLVTNIQNGDVATGETLVQLRAPVPRPSQPSHAYVVLAYRQVTGNLSLNLSDYGVNPTATSAPRNLFNLSEMFNDNNMTFAGITWFRVEFDDYAPKLIRSSTPGNVCDAECVRMSCEVAKKACSAAASRAPAVAMVATLFVIALAFAVLNPSDCY